MSNKVPIFAQIDFHLKQRFLIQIDRLKISQAAGLSMALVKWLEDEEATVFDYQKRRNN